MSDVARMAGVSMMTVSRAYQESGRVSAAARARIAAAAAELGYVPNRAAAQLSSRRSRVIAATIASLSEVQFGNALEGLSGALRRAGYQLLIAECGPSEEEERRAVATVLGYRPDGLVAIGVEHGAASRRMIRGAGIPVVEAWNLDIPAMDMAAGFSDRLAARRMVEHLLATGRRRIGYADYPGPAMRRFAERRRGFEEAMREAGLDATLIHEEGSGPAGLAQGRAAVRALMARDPGMDALFCVTDFVAAGAVLEAVAQGWDVPGRLGVSGFGDFDLAAEIPPGITTISINPRGIGGAAAEMVLARIAETAGAAAGAVVGQKRDLGFELVRRGSA
ncbi:LacI family DNA-binding transcriptional regulator [Muricoccus pecuniae]|uniref:LacI family gluconate utilization system Gnt-I transcriptional repressor n=1 Tax=Muricoccus pecuniae TaxID=693023 RepID=A0A840Y9X8_9PROT|nr:LacI family DNA-binding transcriptional regulator [Roseomonas pecuniae]MBB5693167.1 LacI family gluconate utilization system Gnt-I transcriptional repressor [Roseomonas pecuniae]